MHLVELAARVADLLIIVLSARLAQGLTAGAAPSTEQTISVVVAGVLTLLVFPATHLYDLSRLGHPLFQMTRLFGSWLAVLAGAVLAVFIADPTWLPPRDWLLMWSATSLLGFVVSRLAIAGWVERARREGHLAWHVLLIGSGAWGAHAQHQLEKDRLHHRLVGYIDLPRTLAIDDVEMVLRQALLAQPVDQVALALDAADLHQIPDLLAVLRDFPVEVGIVPQVGSGGSTPTLGYRRLGEFTSVTCLRKPIDGWAWHLKTAFDRAAALLLLAFLMPLMIAIAIAVKLTSPGPIFFKQKRLGFNQQPIDVLKFRSMYVDLCDGAITKVVKQATRDDPRVTPVGRFIRRTSLDELPQLLNVLRGEMSLVGPRPHAVAHDEYYASLIDGYLGRHRAKPGITGWAQINGCRGEIHSLADMRRRIEFDLNYIDNWSLWLDVRILVRTALVCFQDSRAY